jgi:hypothetical protein
MSIGNVARPACDECEPMPNPEARTLLLLLGAAVAINLGPLIPVPSVRAAVVLPVALLAPGYALLVLFAGPRGWGLRPLSVTSSLLLSISVYPLLALSLYVASVSLTTTSLAAGVSVLLLAALAVTAARARSWSGVAGSSFALLAPARWRFGSSAWPLLLGGLVAVAIVVAVRAMPDSVIPEPHHELSLAGDWARLGGVASIRPGQRLAVSVAVVNGTDQAGRYEIGARLQRGGTWAPRNVTLAPGARWQGSVAGEVPGASCLNRLTISLRAGDGGAEAATVGIWLRTRTGERQPCKTRD